MVQLNPYSVQNWYWIVGGNTSQVFSTGEMAYLPLTDSTYAEWAADGNLPTNILNAQELYDVLVQQWVPPYLAAGVQVQSTSAPAINGTYVLDDQAQGQITGIATSIAAGRGLPGGGSSFIYQQHPFNETQFLNFASGVEGFVYGLYAALGQIVLTGSGVLPPQPVVIP